jgi:hypothetical protein
MEIKFTLTPSTMRLRFSIHMRLLGEGDASHPSSVSLSVQMCGMFGLGEVQMVGN